MATHIIDGTVKEIGQEQSWPSGFAKVLVIISEGGSDRESDQIPIEFCRSKMDDNIALLANCAEGDLVRVRYELRGREWQGKHFINLQATGLERLASGADETAAPHPGTPQQPSLPNVQPPTPQEPAPPAPEQPGEYHDSLDDLPF